MGQGNWGLLPHCGSEESVKMTWWRMFEDSTGRLRKSAKPVTPGKKGDCCLAQALSKWNLSSFLVQW